MPLPKSPKAFTSTEHELTKHMIFLFDGTWNSAADGHFHDETNIFRTNLALNGYDIDGIPQITFYMPGPGTRGFLDRELGGIFGQGIDQIIKEAYINLSSNYWPGDKIYFVGFSRGAVAARALSAMIAKCGLLKADYLDRLSHVWEFFITASPTERLTSNKSELVDPVVHPTPQVEFLGLFDAVLGRAYNHGDAFARLCFSDRRISSAVKYGLQILSIDDNRKRYKPILWNDAGKHQHIEQVWMPGVHGDIGGSYGPSFISTVSLLTLLFRMRSHTKLSLDEDLIASELSRLNSFNYISISDERQSLEMKALSYKDRKPDSSPDGQVTHPLSAIGELTHPLFFSIYEQWLIIRNKRKIYTANRLEHFRQLPCMQFQEFETMAPSIYSAISKMVSR